MDTTKHYIEFCNNIFAIEDVLLVERYSSCLGYKDDSMKEKDWRSYIYLGESKLGFYFPESEYEKLRQIIFDYLNNKETKNIEN